jgi:ribosome recycling factor
MQILSVSDLTPGEKHYENVIVMNEEERRELVREAIKAFERWQSSLGSVRRVFTVEDFLDEQGL